MLTQVRCLFFSAQQMDYLPWVYQYLGGFQSKPHFGKKWIKVESHQPSVESSFQLRDACSSTLHYLNLSHLVGQSFELAYPQSLQACQLFQVQSMRKHNFFDYRQKHPTSKAPFSLRPFMRILHISSPKNGTDQKTEFTINEQARGKMCPACWVTLNGIIILSQQQTEIFLLEMC